MDARPAVPRSRDAIDPDFWPEATEVTGSDIVVSGISLRRLVDVCGTPCVHSAAASVIGSRGSPSQTERSAVLAVKIVAIERDSRGYLFVQTDARLDNLRLIWSEARLINRNSTARRAIVLVQRALNAPDLLATDDVLAATLPRDLRVGDVIVVPSRRIITDWMLHPHPLTGTDKAFPESVSAN